MIHFAGPTFLAFHIVMYPLSSSVTDYFETDGIWMQPLVCLLFNQATMDYGEMSFFLLNKKTLQNIN